MKVDTPRLIVVAALVAGAFVVGALLYRGSAPVAPTAENERLVRAHSPTQGPASAPVTLVEFFDPECESCRAMYPIVKQVMTEFDGRVRLVIRYMPLHQNSAYAATLLEAARDQDRYWEYLEVVMARQPEWASHQAPRPELLISYAPMAGLDVEKLRVAATNPDIRSRIEQDTADGNALGANRTPTFFVNGVMLDRLGYEPLRAAVEAALD